MSTTVRLFLALQLPESIRAPLARVQKGLKSHRFNVRWVPPGNIHLTLAFLGEVPVAALEPLYRAVGRCTNQCAAMELKARGIGVFPTIRKARVIWIGLVGQLDRLRSLKQSLDTALEDVDRLAYTSENRPFKAHLTLGRIKKKTAGRRLAQALDAYSDFESEPFTVAAVHVIQSELTPNGAVYTALQRFSLGD